MPGLLISKPACFSNWDSQIRKARVDVSWRVETQQKVSIVYSQSCQYQHQGQVRIALFCSFLRVSGTVGMEQLQIVSLKLGQAIE